MNSLLSLVTFLPLLGAVVLLVFLKGDDEDKVRGLTTAAGIWLTAAIGVAAGMGHESTAVLSTLLTLAIFTLMPHLVALLEKPAPQVIHPNAPKDPP